MGIGAAIALMALGAILTFAVDVSVSGLDIAVIGIVLMLAGAAGLILDLAVFAPRRRRVGYGAGLAESDSELYPPGVGSPPGGDYQRTTDVYEDQPVGRSWRRRRVTDVYRG
ncbi:hypothetical protein Ga0074812_11063 [Parafrankia irregularis]|uniref:DUF6458 domain-containing protein n=1 Tax=Parafrankia irregularis TaxID=795642 RepID=A0A0S4QQ42_9ACTN|nr:MULTISPECIES: DUF6458 family protein [Parafrankia]MBE3206068.1 hypothetical protein [Parafrankia sp. CH37]CUU57048.1 hypothetical protein Ga0074812_11063 [Parafrankia irregularis]